MAINTTTSKPTYLTQQAVSILANHLNLTDDETDVLLTQIEIAMSKDMMAYNEDFWLTPMVTVKGSYFDVNVYDASVTDEALSESAFNIDVYKIDANRHTITDKKWLALRISGALALKIIHSDLGRMMGENI